MGSTNDFERGFDSRLRALRQGKYHNIYLQRAWNKHGEENFVFEVEEEVVGDNKVLLGIEQTYLDEGFELGILYNIARKAGGGNLGSEVNQKISNAMMGHEVSEETRIKLKKPRTCEVKAKISKSLTGRKLTKEHCMNISKGKTNPSEETRANISRASKGRKPSKETKAKMSKSQTGRKHSEETLAKLRACKSGKNNPMYGKGISGKDNPRYGTRHTEETKAKMRVANAGENNGFYGKHHMEEALIKIRDGAAKPYPSFYNTVTKEYIPKGINLTLMCEERHLSLQSMSGLKLGKRTKSRRGWRLASISEIADYMRGFL